MVGTSSYAPPEKERLRAIKREIPGETTTGSVHFLRTGQCGNSRTPVLRSPEGLTRGI